MIVKSSHLTCVVQDNAAITGRSAKKVRLHRRELHVVYRVDPPLERARRNTALNVVKTFEKHKVAYCVDHARIKLVHGMKLCCIFQKSLRTSLFTLNRNTSSIFNWAAQKLDLLAVFVLIFWTFE